MHKMNNQKRGPKGKLTPELEARICELLRGGMSYKGTAGLCHIGEETLYGWLRQGKAEKGTRLARFNENVVEARATLEAICVRTIRNEIVGGWFEAPVYDKVGNPIPLRDPQTGEVIRDQNGRPKMEMKPVFQKPDVKTAKWMVQRTNPREFSAVDQNQLLPTPQAELDKAPTELTREPEPRRITTSLLAQAVKILADQGVEIEGYRRVQEPEQGAIVDAEVVEETKLIEAKPDPEKPLR
jgi:hypothetical protein